MTNSRAKRSSHRSRAVCPEEASQLVRACSSFFGAGRGFFSRRTLGQLKETLIESDVQVYSLGVFDRDYSTKHTPEERRGPSLLDQVALDTGGHNFPVVSLDSLPEIGTRIARELRNQYVLGFSPAESTADGKYHRVNLKLATQNAESELRTYYRQGYYAPGQ